MRPLIDYIEVLDKSLIKKEENIFKHFTNQLVNNPDHKDKKIFKSIMLYKEAICNYSLTGVNTNFSKLLLWIDDANKKVDINGDWTQTYFVLNEIISLIETKNVMCMKNGFERDALLVCQNYLMSDYYKKSEDAAYREEETLDDYLYELESIMSGLWTNYDFSYLIKSCFLQFQIMNIKPLTYNNECIARILGTLFLSFKTYNDTPKISMSSYLLKNKARYFELLDNSKKRLRNISEFINFLLVAIAEGCAESQKIFNDIEELIAKNLVSLQNVVGEWPILASQYEKFTNKFFITREDVREFLDTLNVHFVDATVHMLFKLNVLKYVDENNKNKMIFTNIWEYILKLDEELINIYKSFD